MDIQHVLSQSIWLNPLMKIGGNMCMTKICCENDLCFVNDLIYGNKTLFTYEELMDHYNIGLNFITFHLYVETFQQHLHMEYISFS